MGTVIANQLAAGVKDIGLHYDIMCHYEKNMWSRWETLPVPLFRDDFDTFISAVPKFHLAGHTDQCFVRYSLNHTPGVGRLDGEGGERCWANLNLAARSTSEKGPGARIDTLCQIMDYWNWLKTVDIGLATNTLHGMRSDPCRSYLPASSARRGNPNCYNTGIWS